MKLSSLVFLSIIALIVPFAKGDELYDLHKKWNIDDVSVSNDANDFTFLYSGTDKSSLTPVTTKVQVTMYAYTCKTSDYVTTYGKIGIEDSDFIEDSSPFNMTSLGYDNETHSNLQFKFTVIPDNVAKLNALMAPSVDDNVSMMKFCVRFGLYSIEEVNFKEMKVSIGDHSIDVNKKQSNSAPKTYTIDVSLCTTGNLRAPNDDNKKFTQGFPIRLCFSPGKLALADGAEIISIDAFEWTRDNIKQEVITSKNTITQDGLSVLDQTNKKKFVVTSILYATFFETTGKITANGAVTMAIPTFASNSRRLGGSSNSSNNNKINQIEDGTGGDNVIVVPFKKTTTVMKAYKNHQQSAVVDEVVNERKYGGIVGVCVGITLITGILASSAFLLVKAGPTLLK